MMYAMAMVAEREIPARQCTMTLQFDTLALSKGGEAFGRGEGGQRRGEEKRREGGQSAPVESKVTFPGGTQQVT